MRSKRRMVGGALLHHARMVPLPRSVSLRGGGQINPFSRCDRIRVLLNRSPDKRSAIRGQRGVKFSPGCRCAHPGYNKRESGAPKGALSYHVRTDRRVCETRLCAAACRAARRLSALTLAALATGYYPDGSAPEPDFPRRPLTDVSSASPTKKKTTCRG